MSTDLKPIVHPEETFDRLDIRLGEVVSAQLAEGTRKPAYILRLNFGKWGEKTSVGQFTKTPPESLVGLRIPCVMNFPPKVMGPYTSEVLVLGVQFPKADSGEATPLIAHNQEAKLGGKVF